ncbi:predicted protein [Nematostella vectensis]|uniref:Uncharacterized protein n=1 Tax=Nematostella vectensis TaxID=45351 RepID=A7SV78_NEMVE|nr:uncharacterized protein LOC5503415 [Nematostella vectensis]EDO32401.1 predicted protein [Nematostella vectensis]|eukprot:XP_001624501.1 predicted protein [Nematostella vectensis]
MKISTFCLLLVLVLAVCEGRRPSKADVKPKLGKAELKPMSVSRNVTASTRTKNPKTSEDNLVVALNTTTPTKSTRMNRRIRHLVRRCCKLGAKGGEMGFDCNWDRFTALQYTNIVHRMKMKFQGRKPSRRIKRYVSHVVHSCIKPKSHGRSLKKVYQKCCEYSTK